MRCRKRNIDYAYILGFAIKVADVFAIMGAGGGAYLLRFDSASAKLPENYLAAVVVQALLAALIFPIFQVYSSWRGKSFFKQINKVVQAWSMAFLALLGIAFLTKTGSLFSREWALTWFVLANFLLLAMRLVVRQILMYCRERRLNLKNVVIIGANALGQEIARRLRNNAWLGLNIVCFFDESIGVSQIDGIPVEPLVKLHTFKHQNNVEEVWIALSMAEEEKIRQLLKKLEHCTLNIRFIPSLPCSARLFDQSITQMLGMTVVDLSISPMTDSNRIIKWLEDKFLAALILILISPLLLLIAVGVKLSSPGPIIYKQKRHGWDGAVFAVYKFRSMKVHQEQAGQVTQASRGDPRITPFGAFLRKFNLDELPQFFNVLQGDMSIVGPRPHAIEHNEHYKSEIEYYMRRHKVKPGITGWAQVNGWRGETETVEKMQKRVEHDLYYIEHWSLLFDLKIIILTLLRSFFDDYAY